MAAGPDDAPGAGVEEPSPVSARARLVGGAAAVGAALGVLTTLALLLVADPMFASRKSFAAGALLFGFGLLGWSGSIMAGDGFEHLQAHLDVSSGWTERKSRRAMARIGGVGAGWMVGASVVSTVLG